MAYPSDITGYWWIPSRVAAGAQEVTATTVANCATLYYNHNQVAVFDYFVQGYNNGGIAQGTSIYDSTYGVGMSTDTSLSDRHDFIHNGSTTAITNYTGYSVYLNYNFPDALKNNFSTHGILYKTPKFKAVGVLGDNIIDQLYNSYDCILYYALSHTIIDEPTDWQTGGQLIATISGTCYIWIKAMSTNASFRSESAYCTGLSCYIQPMYPYPENTYNYYYQLTTGKTSPVSFESESDIIAKGVLLDNNSDPIASLNTIHIGISSIVWSNGSNISLTIDNSGDIYIQIDQRIIRTCLEDYYIRIDSDIENTDVKIILANVGIFWKLPYINSGLIGVRDKFFTGLDLQCNCNIKFGVSPTSDTAPQSWYYSTDVFSAESSGTFYYWYEVTGINGFSGRSAFTDYRTVIVHAPRTYNLVEEIPPAENILNGDILNCPYSGSIISISLPAGSYKLECWGGKGGTVPTENISYGGSGGYSKGIYTTTSLNTIYLVTGGAGTNAPYANPPGGYNGGGTGLSDGSARSYSVVAGGGGCSHIATATGLLSTLSANKDAVLLVAGGGGGGACASNTTYSACCGGYGGGLTGGTADSYHDITAATGGSQTAGGTGQNGQQGSGFGQGAYNLDGGGGGGWYGGGPGYWKSSSDRSAGGGGSSYYNTTALTEYTTIAGNASMPAPSGGTETGHASSGYIRITVINVDPGADAFTKIKINNSWKAIEKKYIKIDNSYVTLNNLLNPTSFSLDGHVSEMDGVYTFEPWKVGTISQSISRPTANHKYYGRVYQKASSGSSFVYGDFKLASASTSMIFANTGSSTIKDGEWHYNSAICSLSEIDRYDWNMISQVAEGDSEFYRKEMIVIDLTEAFGEENEPDKEWCDEHIPYFVGQYIFSNSWREIETTYIKLNGYWIEISG